jgi:hypothetical protein
VLPFALSATVVGTSAVAVAVSGPLPDGSEYDESELLEVERATAPPRASAPALPAGLPCARIVLPIDGLCAQLNLRAETIETLACYIGGYRGDGSGSAARRAGGASGAPAGAHEVRANETGSTGHEVAHQIPPFKCRSHC